jgi:ATP-binding cassette subfamily B (MDR/TAP) protein 1
MLGVAFAAQGISQFGNFSEAFSGARVATYEALQTINRKPGSPEEIIYRMPEDDDIGKTAHSKKSVNKADAVETGPIDEKVVKAILPRYEIDSTSDTGLKPEKIAGRISFKQVTFKYPTRPNETVLRSMSCEIEPGQVVAFVGPSGSGKSTVVGLLERFYDPQAGSVALDGVNLKDINVAHLRRSFGYVGQEPVSLSLFVLNILLNVPSNIVHATSGAVCYNNSCKHPVWRMLTTSSLHFQMATRHKLVIRDHN